MDDKVDRDAILKSGIFAFDDNNKLVGIKGLIKPDKTLSERDATVIKIPSHRIKLFAEEITAKINSYLDAQHPNTLQSVVEDFEIDLTNTIKRWDLDAKNLDPHYSNFLKKCQKTIKSNLEQDVKKMAQIGTKPNLRRDALVAGLKRSFDEYIKTDITDTFSYEAHQSRGSLQVRKNYF